MTIRAPHTAAAPLEWVVVANAARARCFARDPENQAMKELSAFIHPESRQKGSELADDRGGLVHKSSTASTQFAPHTDLHDKAHEAFAHEIASYLEDAALAHRYPRVSLIASSAFLGELRQQLGDAARRLVTTSVPLDLTTYTGRELEQRVTKALARDETVK